MGTGHWYGVFFVFRTAVFGQWLSLLQFRPFARSDSCVRFVFAYVSAFIRGNIHHRRISVGSGLIRQFIGKVLCIRKLLKTLDFSR